MFWPFLRLTGVFLTAPVLGSATIPRLHRVLMSALFALCLAAWDGPWPAMPVSWIGILYAGIVQVAFGAGIGFVGQVIVSTAGGAGEIAGAAIGSNYATTVGLSSSPAPPVLFNILYWAGLMVYIGLGGMFWTISAVARSFHTSPGGIPEAGSWLALAQYAGVILESGTLLALPALAAAFALNLATGLANALAPALNIFSVGFPVLLLGGIWVIGSSIFFVEPTVIHLMLRGGRLISHWIGNS